MIEFNSKVVDKPIAALIGDLKRTGLLDSTLVFIGGEFGRTPISQPGSRLSKPGRDHHIRAFPILLAGGGVNPGVTLGKTDEFGWNAVESPIHINDLQATFMKLFGFNHKRLTHRHLGREFRLTDVGGKVIEELIQ